MHGSLRRGALRVAMIVVCAGAARAAWATCNVIPSAALTFRGTLGNTDRPFARPGDWVTVTLDAACHGASPGFTGAASDTVVTLVFTPPAGGPRNVVVLATDCAQVDTAVCAAQPHVAGAACLQVNGPGAATVLERVDQRTLRFRFRSRSP